MKKMGTDRNFTLDALLLTVSAFMVKIIGVIYKVPLSYMLGDEGMGYFNSAYTVFGCFYVICAAGVPKAISILVSEARVCGNESLCEKILKEAKKVFFLIGSAFALLLFVFAKPLSQAVGNSGAAASLITVSFSLVFISVSGVMRGYLNGIDRHVPIALCELIEAVFKLTIGLALAKYSIMRGFSLSLTAAFAVSGISLGAAASSLFLYICIGRKKSDKRAASYIGTDKLLKRVFKISVPIAISSFLMSVTNLIDLSFSMRRLVDIGYTVESATALYGNYTTLAVPFLGLCISLISPISVAALPKLSTAYAKGDTSAFRDNLKHAIYLSALLGAIFSFGCMYFSSEALSFIFAEKSAKTAAPYLAMLSPSFILFGVLNTVNTALEASGRTLAPLLSMSVGALFKIATGYILIGNPDVGIGGAPIGTVVFYAVSLTVSLIILFYRNGVGISVFMPMIACIINAEVAALCARLTAELTGRMLSGGLHTVVTGAVYVALYLILSRIIAYKPKFKEKYGNIAQKDEKHLLQQT